MKRNKVSICAGLRDPRGETHELVGKEKDGLQTKLPLAKVEEILEGRAKQVDNHGVVVTLGAIPSDEWDADTASEGLVHLRLILELGVLGLDGFELDGNLFARDDVYTEVDIA